MEAFLYQLNQIDTLAGKPWSLHFHPADLTVFSGNILYLVGAADQYILQIVSREIAID